MVLVGLPFWKTGPSHSISKKLFDQSQRARNADSTELKQDLHLVAHGCGGC